MKQLDTQVPQPSPTDRPSRRERLQALLFSSAALGTAIAALGLLGDVKLPKSQSE